MNKNNKKSKIDTRNIAFISKLRFFLVLANLIAIFYPPYLQGLFFEKHLLPTTIFIFLIFIIFCIYKWLERDYILIKTPVELVAISFIIIYFISIFIAVHTRSAIIEWLKYCMYFAVFYMISDLAATLKKSFLFLWVIIASTLGVSIIGIDSAIGGNFARLLNKLFNIFGVRDQVFFGLFVDNRINSTLQYPNAMAAYVMSIFFIVMGFLITETKKLKRITFGIFSYVLLITFFLTKSRGALMVFPIACIIFIIALPKGSRIKAIVHILTYVAISSVIIYFISPYLSATKFSVRAFIFLVSGIIGTVFITILLNLFVDYLQRINWKVYIAICSIIIIAIIFTINLIINNNVPVQLSHSLQEKDGTIMISRDVSLTPNKTYTLFFSAETQMNQEKPYIYDVSISNKNIENILFGGNTLLTTKKFKYESIPGEQSVEFIVPENSRLISITFKNYYSGTGVILDNARIIENETGKKVKQIILKNKYNLEDPITTAENIRNDKNGLTRLIYYTDGLKMLKSNWILGRGGGAWEYMYREYQSYNYSSTQAHNYPLQLAIEVGLLGILALVALLYFIGNAYIKYYRKQSSINLENKTNNTNNTSGNRVSILIASSVSAMVALFIHSAIDFDFSESAMLLLFWQLIAIFNSEIRNNKELFETMSIKIIKQKGTVKANSRNVNKSNIAILCVVFFTFIILFFSFRFQLGRVYAEQTYINLKEGNFQKAVNSMNYAIKSDPYNEKYLIGYNPIPNRPDITIGVAELLIEKSNQLKKREEKGEKITQNELVQLNRSLTDLNEKLRQLEKTSKHNLSLSANLSRYYFNIGQTEKGIDFLTQSISLYPFEPTLWQSKVNVYFQLMSSNYNNENLEQAKEYLDLGLKIIDDVKTINKNNMNPFVFNKETIDLLQKMQYMNDYWGKEELKYINNIVHYLSPEIDLNLDDIPDQWTIYDKDKLDLTIIDEGIAIKTNESSFIYTEQPIIFREEKAYTIEIQLKEPVNYLYYNIDGITEKTIYFESDGNKYQSTFYVSNEPNMEGNRIRIYSETDCIIDKIIVKEN